MPKRFTDTDKWKKPFIRSLEAPYKLLWFYILDDCDHAGIWQVDFEVACIRTGQLVNEKKALQLFAERIEPFDGGTKWFLKDFIFFQYGELNPKNRLHLSVINILSKHQVGAYKVLPRTQGQEQGNGQGTRQGFEPPEVFETKQQAHKEITGNYHDVEKARSILSNRGWVAATDNDVGALLFHFLETNDDATEKPKAEVRQHFKNWINKYDLNELTKLSISISTRFRQRQQV